LSLETVVDDVLHINGVEVIGPGMQDLEAFVLDALLSVSLNIIMEEVIACLIGLNGVSQVILLDSFLGVAEETTDGLDARCALKVLLVYHFFDSLFQILIASANFLYDAGESAFESL